MHEMSLATSLLHIIREEMQKHGASRLVLARVRFGPLANVVPEALSMAFEVLTADTDLEGARLELDKEEVLLACGDCGREFSPPPDCPAMLAACPQCGHELGHRVLTGKSLYLEHLEVE